MNEDIIIIIYKFNNNNRHQRKHINKPMLLKLTKTY